VKQRAYPAPGVSLPHLAEAIALDLGSAGYDVRTHRAPTPGADLVQLEVRRANAVVQETTGQGAALKVLMMGDHTGFRVQIATERWGDKAAGAVEWLMATPALVTEGYAAFQRSQLDERVFRTIDAYLAGTMATPPNRAPAAVPTAGPCARCKTPMPMGGRFCPRCGHDAHAAPTLAAACPGCKHPVDLDAAFCPGCGKSLAKAACAQCKTPLDDGAMFCPGCGTPAASASKEPGAP
jgi:RNA polymerase subunit RPABC4/transcription elongation factor Spt4